MNFRLELDNGNLVVRGPKGKQWLLRVDDAGAVVARRALFASRDVAAFVGADLDDEDAECAFDAIMIAWETAEGPEDYEQLLLAPEG